MNLRFCRAGLSLGCLAVLGMMTPVGLALADNKQECLKAYDNSQTLRQQDKLVSAREQLLVCARNECPEILRKDCTQWLDEVDASMSTVVLSVKSSKGQDLVDVTVTVDGEPFVTQIDGKAVAVDPGVHVFRFATPDTEPIEKRIVIYAAAKNQAISVQFSKQGEGEQSLSFDGQASVDGGGPPVMAYVFGGIGLVGLGGFALFGSQFKSKLDDMDKCKPNCPQEDADSASTSRTLAFVSAGVGVVSLGVSAYLFLASSGQNEVEVSSIPRVDVLPVRGGAVGAFSARF